MFSISALHMAEGMVLRQSQKHEPLPFALIAPDVDETLRPDDARTILEELLDAQNHAHLLGLMMNVKPRDVEAIQTTYQQPKDRLLHIIIAFLQQAEPMPTWRAIVDALKSPVVGLTALARRVEAAHFPDPTAGRETPAVSGESVTNQEIVCKCTFHLQLQSSRNLLLSLLSQ